MTFAASRRACLVAALACAACGGPHRPRAPLSADAAAQLVVVGESRGDTTVASEREPNDSPATAQPLVLQPYGAGAVRAAVHGSLGAAPPEVSPPAGDIDVYRLDAPDGPPLVLRAELEGASGRDLTLELLGGNGGRLVLVDNGGAGEGEVLSGYTLLPGTYYLRVAAAKAPPPRRSKAAAISPAAGQPPPSPRPPAPASYRLAVKLAPPLPGQEAEPNDDLDHANPLELGQERHGVLGWREDRDLYRVPVLSLAAAGAPPGPGAGLQPSLRIDLDGLDRAAAEVAVLDDAGGRIAEARVNADGSLTLRHVGLPSGTRAVWIAVRARGRGAPDQAYDVRVTAEDDTLPTEVEPNDTPERANRLELPAGTVLGNLPRGDVDCYALALPAAASLSFDLRPPRGQTLALEVSGDGGAVLGRATGDGPGRAIELRDLPAAPGTVTLRLTSLTGGEGAGANLPYRLTWSATAR